MPWAPNEDETITSFVDAQGPRRWRELAALLPGRTAKQCRDRWHNQLQLRASRGSWTADEDEMLAELFARFGPRWAKIAESLPRHSHESVKNRWFSTRQGRLHTPASPEKPRTARHVSAPTDTVLRPPEFQLPLGSPPRSADLDWLSSFDVVSPWPGERPSSLRDPQDQPAPQSQVVSCPPSQVLGSPRMEPEWGFGVDSELARRLFGQSDSQEDRSEKRTK
jgi:hypothetical protein